MSEKMIREVSNVPGSQTEVSRIDFVGVSIEDRHEAACWLRDNGAAILTWDESSLTYTM